MTSVLTAFALGSAGTLVGALGTAGTGLLQQWQSNRARSVEREVERRASVTDEALVVLAEGERLTMQADIRAQASRAGYGPEEFMELDNELNASSKALRLTGLRLRVQLANEDRIIGDYEAAAAALLAHREKARGLAETRLGGMTDLVAAREEVGEAVSRFALTAGGRPRDATVRELAP